MAEAAPVELPKAAIRDMLRWFKAAKIPGVVIGGVAVSLQGHARHTRDLDALVVAPESQWPKFLGAATRFGFSGRIPDVLEFARASRMLLMQHDASGIPLDISLGALDFEVETIRRAVSIKLGRLNVPVAGPEDLIIMKAVAGRLQDLADIDNVLEAHLHLDVQRIRATLGEFAEILDRPEIVENFAPLWARRVARRRK